ncbi:MAG: Flp1 family type IVb pilin [Schaedlerella sp.]|nr:Flp1 family type IVb pilin [Schaedlerella sp.]
MFYFKKIVDFKNNAALKIRRTAAEGKRILQDTSGMTVVELLLILVVLIALVLIFKTQLTELVKTIFDKITRESAGI